MFLQAYGSALAIVVASLIVGQALCIVCGGPRRWSAGPAVGLAALIVLAGAAIKLPGRAVSACVICGLALLASVALLIHRRRWPARWGDVLIMVIAIAGMSVPFVASRRVGLPGVSLDNDSALHLLYAETLRSSRMAALWGVQNGYPLGPHSLVATLGTATGAPLDMVLTGLLIAVAPITALVASEVIAGAALWRRVIVGVVCSLSFLIAAYYGEGAFKETIMAALVFGYVICVGQLREAWTKSSARFQWALLIPPGLIVAAAVYTYSLYGVGWFVLITAAWGAAETIRRPRLIREWVSWPKVAWLAPRVVLGGAVFVIVLLPVAGQALSFVSSVGVSPASGGITTTNLGNLAGRLSPYESLGIWWSLDFRHVPANAFHAGELAALALAVVAFGFIWSIRRRELLLPAAAAACALIWWYSDRTQSPYVAAKALVIASPLFVAIGLRALLAPVRRPRSVNVAALGVAAVYVLTALYSSYQTLRSEPVGASETSRELSAFHRVIGSSAVLFLGVDDFAPWQLQPAAVTTLSPPTASQFQAQTRPNKPFISGQALDFDSVLPGDLDRFRYVVTSNTQYASEVPANFRLIANAPLYQLWERAGPTVARQVFEPPGAPGALLNCRSPAGRRLRSLRGQAAVMTPPVIAPGVALAPGESAVIPLALASGRWEISAQTVSGTTLAFSAQGHRWRLPAYLGRPGPFFGVGSVSGLGPSTPVLLTVRAVRPSSLAGLVRDIEIPQIALTRLPDTRVVVPLDQACGRYVDWYRVTPG